MTAKATNLPARACSSCRGVVDAGDRVRGELPLPPLPRAPLLLSLPLQLPWPQAGLSPAEGAADADLATGCAPACPGAGAAALPSAAAPLEA